MSRRNRQAKPSADSREAVPRPALWVGLGASAGGLEALQQFFANVPADSGLVFVVVQHLEPHHPSLLVELLGRYTSLPVAAAADGVRAESDRVYVIPPGTLLTLLDGTFRVTTATDPNSQAPIDRFLRSLADEACGRAVGIVLSGAGHDGTAGLRAIKERGGLTLAQSPQTAKHGSMPESAIAAGLVDHVLPPDQMAAKVLEHAGYLAAEERAGGADLDTELAAGRSRICELVQQSTGHDFAKYKEGTLLRRIRRRMQILRVRTVDAYVQRLARDPAEAESLVKDLLIGVTQFFREPEAFQALAQQVVPLLAQANGLDAPVRIWVAGCASGEEAYSIAMLMCEHLERLQAARSVQIFATDLDAELLAEARLGRYPLSIAEQVSPERLARFFVQHDRSYQAGKELRDMCIFSEHSLIRDPPFSQLDLISCRNVLIYLNTELQTKLIPLFHYALRPGGFLLLGPSEGIAGSLDLFETIDKKSRLFRRRETVARPVVDFPLAPRRASRPMAAAPADAGRDVPPATLQQRANAAFERMTLDEYAAPSAVVNARGDLLFVAGRLGRYFQLPSGAVTTNLVEVLPATLRLELRRALDAAATTRRKIVREDVRVELDDAVRRVRLIVRPLPGIEPEAGLLAVVIQEHAPLETQDESDLAVAAADQPAVDRLETELRATRAELKSTVEDLESTNEELKSSNEELISTNEELQSANEELQTSKEELQSLNEELETVNTELRQKLDELATANSDLQNLFASTEVATIFLDRELRVAKFTPAATALFHLLESDAGRPIADLAPRFEGRDLVDDCREVLRSLKPEQRQVQSASGNAWFILRILPYRTVANVIAGVVVTFVDITELKRAEEALRESEERFRVAQELSPDGFLLFRPLRDGTGAVTDFLWIYENDAAARMNDTNPKEVRGKRVSDVLPHHDKSAFHAAYKEVAETGEVRVVEEAFYDQDTFRQRRWFRVAAVPTIGGDVAVLVQDVTTRRSAEEAQARLAAIVESSEDAILSKDLAGTILTWNHGAERMFGYSAAEAIGRPVAMIIPEERGREEDRILERVAAGERVDHYETERITKDGLHRTVWITISPVRSSDGRVIGASKIVRDITDRKRYEEAVQAHRRLLDTVVNHVPAAVNLIRGSDLRLQLTNPAYQAIAPGKDMVGKTLDEIWPETGRQFAELCQKVLETGDPHHVDDELFTIRRQPDGPLENAYFSWSLHRVPLPGGDGWGILNTAWETTERKRAEEALRASEERFRALAESLPNLVWSADAHGVVGYRNRRWVDYAGGPPDREAAEWLDLIHPEDRQPLVRCWEESVHTGAPLEFEYRLRRSDGQYRWFIVRGYPLRASDGTVVRWFGTSTDIHELREAREAMERSRRGLSQLAEASLSVIAKTDLKPMLQAIAQAALALTGARMATSGHGLVGSQAMVGGSARVPGAPDCPPGDMFRLEKGGVHMALAEGATSIRLSDAELHAHARWWGLPEGHIPMRGLLGVPMRGRSGQTNGMILVTDKDHGDFNDEDESLLTQLATVASLALQHVEVRISLEEADRRKNEFLAMLSHELRNPLAPICASIYILEHATPGSQQTRRAQAVIDRQVAHMTRLVDDLLDLTRISRGKIQLQRQTLDLGSVVRRAVDDHRSAFSNAGVQLGVSIPDGPIPVDGDPTRVAQIIGNLLQNASKFTGSGGTVSVDVESNEALAQAIVRVRDTGAGIAEDMLPRIFEPFTQADTTLDRRMGGLGLGLALVKGLVEMHGGSVSVESGGLGKGAEFIVRLPLKPALVEEADRRRVASPRGPARRVLVIEDNVDGAESLRDLLELTGHTVEIAFSGGEGIEKVASFRPDVVLCDIGLPGMNGYEVARRMRANAELRSLRLVALSGYASPDDVAKSRAAGFDVHVAKPPSVEKIAEALNGG